MPVELGPVSARIALLAFFLAGTGCTKKAVEVEVRDPGRVQVALRSGSGASTVLLPDGRDVVVPLPPSGEARPLATRRGRTIAIEWAACAPRVELVDAQGVFAPMQTDSGVKLTGPLLYADYDVTEQRAFEPGARRDGAIPVQLATPLDNVARAEQVSERRKWPAYVLLPLGSLLALAGTLVLVNTDSDLERVGGALYLAAGLPMIGYSVYILTDPSTVTPIAPTQ